MDVAEKFPVRKTKKQKMAFRESVIQYAQSAGYTVNCEKVPFGSNIVIGDPEQAKYLITAHYDTPAAMVIPNLITPCNPVMFILYQLFVVLLFLGISVGVGFTAGLLLQDGVLGYNVGLIVYWVLLLLMLLGPANRNNANDNTSGVVTVLTVAQRLPGHLRDKVCFVLFDLEEAGLVGSSAYRKTHKTATEKQIVLNLDCVGDGDEILLIPGKKLKNDPQWIACLKQIEGDYDGKKVSVRDNGFTVYPSDQKNFPLGVGIAAFRRSPIVGLYCGKIHTFRDKVLDEKNVNTLCSCLLQATAETAE